MHSPGIEPGAHAWKASMLPLHQECLKGGLERRNRTADYLRTDKPLQSNALPLSYLEIMGILFHPIYIYIISLILFLPKMIYFIRFHLILPSRAKSSRSPFGIHPQILTVNN